MNKILHRLFVGVMMLGAVVNTHAANGVNGQRYQAPGETSYHFEEAMTICENENFSWHGMDGLNRQGIGATSNYYDRYVTTTGKDSIYHLALTVHPVIRRTQTIPFCGSIEWNGRTYTESTVVVDTLSTVLGCDSIITTILVRGIPFHHHDTATIVPGETITWHGLTIHNSGLYEDKHQNSMGCDSVYTLGVGLKEAVPQMNMRTDYVAICEGDDYLWRGRTYRYANRYVDTLYTDNTKTQIDSLFVLVLSVNPRYNTTERVTFRDFPVAYRNTLISGPGTYPIHYTASTGCDSIITVIVDREVIRDELTVTICPGETYIWRGHAYQESHRYVETETDANGIDSVEHILNLTVRYIPETRITRTICRGASYTFADQTLTESGIYTHTYHDTGCDSVVILSLNVLNADTVKYIRHMNEGESYTWHNKIYHETGVDFYTTQNRFGCDSTEMLILTVNHVDTIDSVATICPGETITWHGIRASQSGLFTNPEQQPSGDFIYYRLHLTVLELQEIETSFTICGNEQVEYNGKTYSDAGYYYDKLGCDTLVRIHIKKNPIEVHETRGSLGGTHGFTWTYMDNGTEKTDVFNQPGTYEYESPNTETGCSDLWRLVLTKDENTYHFVENLTICEGEDFSWRGLNNLGRQVGNNIHYYDRYKTRTGNDSIYELVLTVLPAKRTVNTITFCGQIVWEGRTYTHSAVVYDTLAAATGCDSIVRINLDKASSFFKHDTATIVQGETLIWHGQHINTDGLYRDAYTTQFGCDSVYELGVGVIAATPHTNLVTTQFSICDGEVYTWRNKDYQIGGTYVDTIWAEGRSQVDSIYVLRLTVLPSYRDTIVRHMYSCSPEAGIRYNGQDYYQSQTVIENLRTIDGCDSIVKIFMHIGEPLYQRDTVRIGDTKLPYAWRPNNDTTIYLSTAGTHTLEKEAEGGCNNIWELYLEIYPSFLREDSIAICESELPFYWQNGPVEHQNDAISGLPGQTRVVEYSYPGTIPGVDSIYRLKLYIMPQAKHIEQITLCEGQQKTLPNGKTYYMLEADSVYRDTVYFANPNMPGCDSIVYYEIQQFAALTELETKILHVGETISWHGQTITSGGPYQDIIPGAAAGGCDSIYRLNVVQEMREEMVVCKIDTPDLYPVIWRDDTIYTSGLWTDTVYENGFIKEYHSLDLTITLPYDTTIYLKGCDQAGVTWRDETFMQDTAFIDRVPVTPYDPKHPCDSVFHVNIKVGRTYNITITDTICESDLPYILGRQNPDTIWTDARHRPQPHTDTTACGCDSTVNLVLYITPTLAKNDSTFACEDEIAEHPVVLGDTITPWFQYREDGRFADVWRGKWTGVEYTHDTIVWDCNHQYFHHIIVRPRQTQLKDTTYYLCEGDSVQLFWPKDTMIKTPGIYYDTVVNVTPWYDTQHSQYIHNDRAYACDSIVRWTVRYADALTVDTTERHIALGDSLFWGGEYHYFTGYYDSICDSQQGLQDSEQRLCKEHHWLHLIADTVYHFLDTIHICHPAYLEYTHTFADGHELKFNTPDQDTAIIYLQDSTKQIQYSFYDRYYDLVVYYHRQYLTQIVDTICEGAEYRFDIHRNNTTIERWLNHEGTYRDTLEAMNGCDSIIELRLRVRYRNEVTHRTDMITDRELPYLWSHTWSNGTTDTTVVDTLHYSGEYRFVMPSIHGCDSVDSLHLTIHETHVFRDTIQVCSPADKTHTHVWSTGHQQQFTVPQTDQQIHYYDTLRTFIPMDSIYDLLVDYHVQTITYLDSTLCEGDSLRFGLTKAHMPRFLTKTGVYRDTLTRIENGCDSIIELRLNVFPRYNNHQVVNIADTDTPYIWPHYQGGQLLTNDTLYASGEYTYHFHSDYSCDSIDSLSLRIHTTYLFRDTVQICQSETPYTWFDRQDIYETGEYTKHFQTHDGYDSTYVRYIRVMPVTYDTIEASICEGDSLQFGLSKHNTPRFLYNAGIYTDTLVNSYNCDSIITLRLNIYPRHREHHLVDIADTDTPYIWPHYQDGHLLANDTLYAAGEYAYHFQSHLGCDSIDSLSLRIHTTYLFRDTVTICSDQTPYTWFDRQDIYETGEYTKHFQTHDGYDSTYVRYIRVMPVTYDTIEASICEGDSLRFGLSKHNTPRFLYNAGIYTDTLVNSYNCDSIITLRLNIYPRHREHHLVDIADTDTPYIWPHYQDGHLLANDTLYAAGEYAYHFQSHLGCDSIDSLSLRIHTTYLFRDTVTICSDQTPYTWFDRQDIYETGEYTKHFQTHDGYDSTYVRYIRVLPVIHDTIRHAMCEGSSYDFHGNTYYEPGVYHDTLSTTNGCDSIVTLILTVNQPYYNVIRETILEGHTYEFYGQTYNTTGTYTHYARTPEGCDSTTVLQLSVHPLVDTLITVCRNDLPVIWQNRWNGSVEHFYSEGLYRNDTTISGEKRFYGIQVRILEQVFDTVRHAMCEGSSYDFRGRTLYEQGIYRDTLTAANGCDSILTLILTVNEPYYHIIRETVLEGQYYVFFGDTIRQTMTVSHSGRTPDGCDSTTVLELTVHQLVDTVVTVCSSELPYVWTNRWNGLQEKYYGAGTYRNDTTINGEHFYYGIQLFVTQPSSSTVYREICEGNNYNFNGRMLTAGGEYRDTLRNAVGCDSIIILHLNVLKKYYHTVERSIYEGDTVHFEGQTYSTAGIYPVRYTSSYGCDSIVELHLSVNRVYEDSISICANAVPYIWRGKTIYESGVYRDTVTNTDGRQTVLGLMVNVLPITHAPEPIVATICEGDFYRFNGRILTTQGTYYDTLTAQNGCDSIVMLSLQVMPVKYQTITKRIFEGDSIQFDGQWLKTSGVYERRTKNEYGCTDTEQLILTVLKEFRLDTTAYVCDNELPFIWRGYEYNESGDYTLPIAWTDSSRVVKTLHLTVNPAFYGIRNISICQGDTFKFKGNAYTENGEFLDIIPSGHGCDSIIKYIVSVHPTFDHIFEKHISDKQPYDFHGRILTQTGTYEWTSKTVSGCDSVEHLLLTVHPSYFISDTVHACQSDTSMYPYRWRGREIIKSGTYRDTTLTSYGFDSVCELVLRIHPSYYLYEQYELAEGQTMRLHGKDITKPGVYEDTLTSIFGCDSIYHIVVNLKRVKEITLTDSICQGDFYDFFGKQLTQSGKYVHVSDDKTTVTTLTLKVLPISMSEKRVVIANNKNGTNYYIYNSKLYNNLPLGASEFTEIYRNRYNCDSIFRLIIVVTDRVSEWDQIPLCPGHEIRIDADTIREAGLYTYVRRNKDNGELDSLYRVEVFDAPDYDFPTIQRTICDGDTCFVGGKAFTRSGHHDVTLQTIHGCDSIYHLDLTVNPSYHFITDTTIIDYESVIWRGKTYNESGVYDRSWPTIHDCDSTYTLQLTVIPTQRDTLIKTICADDSYFWRGKTYSVDGFYSDTVRSIETNFSAIYSLRLITAYPTTITTARTSEVCADDDAFDIEFEYDGAKPEYYNVYFDALAKREGFRDVINAKFGSDMIAHIALPTYTTVAYESDTISYSTYVRPDYYTMRLVLDNGICGISQSTDLTLLVKYPSWIIQQNWDDVVAPLRPELNGGYNFVQYEWYVNNELAPMHGLGYLHNDNLQEGDEVVLRATREGDNYSIPTCPIVIRKSVPTTPYPTLDVYPTQAPRYAPVVTLRAEQDGAYNIYSSTGTLVQTGTFRPGEQQLTLPAVNGLWFIRTQTESGYGDTHKIMIY